MIYSFADATAQLKQRIGNRNDITDAALKKYVNQAQHVMATNIRGLNIFEHEARSVPIVAGEQGYHVTDLPPDGLGLQQFWAFQTILDITDAYAHRRLYRGEWDIDLQVVRKPVSPPTLWYHYFSDFLYFNTFVDKPRVLYIIYRRTPTLDTLEIPDEWFEHMLNLACTFVYPTIGRNKERDDLFAKMPQNLQIAVLNPMSPIMWESTFDPGMAIYAEH